VYQSHPACDERLHDWQVCRLGVLEDATGAETGFDRYRLGDRYRYVGSVAGFGK
jgi:hypothetical protein